MEALLPPGIGAPVALALAGTSFLTSMMTAALGIGGGVLLLAVMASLVPPAALIPVHGVVQFGSNFGRAAILLRRVALPVLPPFLAGAVLGAAVGGSVAVTLPPAAMELGVGLFILVSLVAKFPPIRGAAPVAGAVTSLLTMFFGATGPFVAAFLRQTGLQREAFVATNASLMAAQHFLKVAVFGLLGFAYGPWLPLIAAMVTTGFAGTVVGRRILLRIDERFFQRVLGGILLVLALRLVLAGGAALAG